jgi:hypothetical protein
MPTRRVLLGGLAAAAVGGGVMAKRPWKEKPAPEEKPKIQVEAAPIAAEPVSQPVLIRYTPRMQFVPFHERKERFACLVCHRRAGKTVACIHDLQRAALSCDRERPRFAYLSPYLKQSKQVAWDYLKDAATPLVKHGATFNESELRVDYPNGAQVRLYGADNMHAMRGVYLDGIVLDEHSDNDPRIWPEVIRPALADRKGWAVFIGTPRGRNSFYELYERAKLDPSWFTMMLKASETHLLDDEELRLARDDLSEDVYLQEFECSFDAGQPGSYYNKLITAAEAEGRIGNVPYDSAGQVWTAWDLGMRDSTAIWFLQPVGKAEVRAIDFYESRGQDLAHYVKQIKSRDYVYGGHIVPHDVMVKELGTGKSRYEVLETLGLRGQLELAPQHRVEEGINGVRVFLPRVWFDRKKCKYGIDALRQYRSVWDDKLGALKSTPLHDWTSHAADAMRYAAMALDKRINRQAFTKKLVYPQLGVV